MTASLKEKLARPGSRKILALDGGGIRGILTIEVLDQIESALRTALGKKGFMCQISMFDYCLWG
jgi:patatin-like phospholipase/acyl hydrolase